MWNDVKEYVRTCSVCQTTNDAKLVKEAAPSIQFQFNLKYGDRYDFFLTICMIYHLASGVIALAIHLLIISVSNEMFQSKLYRIFFNISGVTLDLEF